MHMHLKQKQQQYMQAAVQAPPPRVRATLRPYCRQTHQAPKQHPKISSWLSEGGGEGEAWLRGGRRTSLRSSTPIIQDVLMAERGGQGEEMHG